MWMKRERMNKTYTRKMRNDPIHKWLRFGFLSLHFVRFLRFSVIVAVFFSICPVLIKSFWHSWGSWNDIFVLIFWLFATFPVLFMSFSGALQLVKLHSAHKMKQNKVEHSQDWFDDEERERERWRDGNAEEWETIIDQFGWEWKIYLARVINCL